MSRSTEVGGGKHVAAGEGRMSRSTGGVGGNIYRYAFIIYKLNQGRRRRKDIPFQREWGTGEARGRRRRRDVPFHRVGGGGKHTSLCQNKNQVPFHRGGGGGKQEGRMSRSTGDIYRYAEKIVLVPFQGGPMCGAMQIAINPFPHIKMMMGIPIVGPRGGGV